MIKRKFYYLVTGLFLLPLALLALPIPTNAATASFYLSPPSQTHTIGSAPFNVSVRLNASAQPVDVITVNLSYPTSQMELVGGVGYAGTFEAAPPGSESITPGNISFTRYTLTPENADVLVATLSFRMLTASTATVSFQGGTLAISGGNNVTGTNSNGSYTGQAPAPPPPPPSTPPPSGGGSSGTPSSGGSGGGSSTTPTNRTTNNNRAQQPTATQPAPIATETPVTTSTEVPVIPESNLVVSENTSDEFASTKSTPVRFLTWIGVTAAVLAVVGLVLFALQHITGVNPLAHLGIGTSHAAATATGTPVASTSPPPTVIVPSSGSATPSPPPNTSTTPPSPGDTITPGTPSGDSPNKPEAQV